MTLAEIKQLDQKNRLHINMQYLNFCNIRENSKVLISVNTNTKTITIKPINENELVKDSNTKSKIENFC